MWKSQTTDLSFCVFRWVYLLWGKDSYVEKVFWSLSCCTEAGEELPRSGPVETNGSEREETGLLTLTLSSSSLDGPLYTPIITP